MNEELPQGWESKELSETVVLQRGFDLPTSARRAGCIPVLGSNGQVGTHDEFPGGVPVPTVTVGRSGSVGKVGFSHSGAWPLNTTLFAKDYCGNDPKYIYFWLQHFDLARYAQGVSVPTLNRNSFSSILVSVPPLSEQQHIARVLDRCCEAVATERAAEELANELKRAVTTRLFTCGLRGESQKETEIGLVPESWELNRLGEMYETQLGKMLSQKAHGGDSPKPYLRNKNVQWGRLDLTDLLVMDFDEREEKKFRLVPGDLLICEGGIIGRAAIWQGELEECYYQKALHRVRPRSAAASNEFLCHWLSFSFENQNLYSIGGASSTIAHLPQVLLDGLRVPFPSEDEQREIVVILDSLDRKIALHRQKGAVLAELFQSLLHKLMTGKIRVGDLDLSALPSASTVLAETMT